MCGEDRGGWVEGASEFLKAQDVADKIGARIAVAPMAVNGKEDGPEVDRFYAGDRMSDILRQASSSTLLVTRLTGSSLIRAASLMDLPALCLLGGAEMDPVLEDKAREEGTLIMVSPLDRIETLKRLNEILEGTMDPQ